LGRNATLIQEYENRLGIEASEEEEEV